MMIRAIKTAGMALGLLALSVSAAEADVWVKTQSDHFTVYSNTSSAVTKRFVTKLEGYYFTLYQLYQMGHPEANTARPRFEAFLLNSRADMRAVIPDISDSIAGFYNVCSEGAAAYSTFDINRYTNTLGSHISSGDEYDFHILFHEYAHHFTSENYTVPVPRWYVEGFAEYYSTITIDGRNIAVGAVSPDRFEQLTNWQWLPYADILRDKTEYKNTDQLLAFYAQSWLLTHYIMTSAERLKAFSAYINAVNGGEEPVHAFERNFGIRIDDLPKVLKAYLAKGEPVISFTFNTMPTPNITQTVMPASANKLLMWQSALQTCLRSDKDSGPELLKQIEDAAAQNISDPWAQLVEARAEIVLGDPSKVEASLSARAVAEPDSAEVQYLLDRLYYKKARSGTNRADDMAKARATLLKAYKLDPMFAPGLYYLSLAQGDLPSYPNATAVNAATEASYLAPAVETYAVYAAQLLVQTDRTDDAVPLLEPIASDPHGGASAARAKAVLAAIDGKKPKAEILAILNAPVIDDK